LCWSAEQALDTDLNYLTAAYMGYIEVLEDIFGTTEEQKTPVPNPRPSPQSGANTLVVSRDARGQPITLTPNIFDIQFDEAKPSNRRKPN
jgi:hypothetical protein